MPDSYYPFDAAKHLQIEDWIKDLIAHSFTVVDDRYPNRLFFKDDKRPIEQRAYWDVPYEIWLAFKILNQHGK